MNRKEEMERIADELERRKDYVICAGYYETAGIMMDAAAALRASAAPEEGGWDSRSIAVGHVLDWLRNRPGISWQATINDIEKAVADLAVRALPSDSGKAAPVAGCSCPFSGDTRDDIGSGKDPMSQDNIISITGRTMQLVRNEIIEECAKIADQFGEFPGPESVKMIRSMCATAIAEKIRALAVSSTTQNTTAD